MQRIDSDLSIGTLGLRVIRTLNGCHCATAHGLAKQLHSAPTRMRAELNHLHSLGVVLLTDSGWTVSDEGLAAWRGSLEGRLLGVG